MKPVTRMLAAFLIFVAQAAAATTLEITDSDTTGGISLFAEVAGGPATTVVGTFLGTGIGTATMDVTASETTGAIVLAVLFEAALNPAASVQIFLDTSAGMFEIENALLANTPTFSIPAVLTEGVNQFSFVFSNVNNGNIALTTSVTAVPVPAAAWLFLTALAGLFVVRRRGGHVAS